MLEIVEKEPLKENGLSVEKSEEEEKQAPRSVFRALRGYFLILAFSFCISINSILIKMSYTLSGSDAGTIRFALQFIIMFILAKYKQMSILGPTKERRLLMFRALSGVIAMISGFFAIKFINPADTKVISHSNIIFTAILARIFLQEKLTLMHIVTFLLTVIGVLFIAQPKFLFPQNDNFIHSANVTRRDTSHQFTIDPSIVTLIGVLLAIISALGAGSSRVILKKLCMNKVHFVLPTIYASYLGLPISLLISITLTLTGVTHTHFLERELRHLPLHLVYTICAAFIGVFGQVLLNLALKYEDATKLGITKTVDVLFAFILQYIFLNIKVNRFSVIGALSILVGAVLLLLFKIFEENREREKKSKNCIFVKF